MPSAGAGVGTWKSARPDKGSVTSYAKDVQEKIKTKKVSEKAVKATAEGRRMARKQSQAHFTEKSIISFTPHLDFFNSCRPLSFRCRALECQRRVRMA